VIEWSQPEILLYHDDPYARMSYPDLIESNDHYYVTETQKYTARVHRIDDSFLEVLFKSRELNTIAERGLLLDMTDIGPKFTSVAMPGLPQFTRQNWSSPEKPCLDLRNGLSVELWLTLKQTDQRHSLFDSRNKSGNGILITAEGGAVKIALHDGRTESSWTSDPMSIHAGKLHHVVMIVDGGPKIIRFVIDGVFCDGGQWRQFGWGRYSPSLTNLAGHQMLSIGNNVNGQVHSVRIYNRALMTAEAVGNYRAGRTSWPVKQHP